ncbi:hypothetical protein GCG21_07355 [Pseudactinotalea sp. HY160]|uniref:hypothetical protein n=1 Tax=Pseudactinotalea sp. HY160 TaxID=2654490 RepID=UPI00128E31DD|nr:hypothetical protein [Pseudactinotalea sp. HY160]MPV49820.1 hypothetical protein [Pseudactinotalea sp. HY160]
MRPVPARLLAAAAGAGATLAAGAVLRARPPRGADTWRRTNFRGRSVSLLGGVAAGAGAVAVAAGVPRSTPSPAHSGPSAARIRTGALLATVTAAAIGAADDLAPDAGASKGLRGHLGALARGEVTTGAVKLLGISGAALLAAAITAGGGRPPGPTPPLPARLADVLVSGGLIAGSANLVNLFDLRPGRGLKAVAVLAAPLACAGGRWRIGAPLAAGALGVVAAAAPGDLAEETMLGDVGANALGALVGTALALQPSTRLRVAALAGIAALTVASEKVSFSAVIAATPALRRIDDWGREPADPGPEDPPVSGE